LETVDKKEAITAVEESSIVFIDEIDKICTSRDSVRECADASAEGVQRDLLPLIEERSLVPVRQRQYRLHSLCASGPSVKPSDRNCKVVSRFVSGERTHGDDVDLDRTRRQSHSSTGELNFYRRSHTRIRRRRHSKLLAWPPCSTERRISERERLHHGHGTDYGTLRLAWQK
jgi:hypothetical protein